MRILILRFSDFKEIDFANFIEFTGDKKYLPAISSDWYYYKFNDTKNHRKRTIWLPSEIV